MSLRKIKKVFLFLGIGALLLGGALVYFLVSREAPITQGNIEYKIKYRGELELDLYEPTQEIYEQRPVLVYIHGGAWIGGAKVSINNDRFHGAINHLRDAGYVVISPDYTLAENGKSPFPDCIEDAFHVIRWIENHAETHRLDLNNVGIMGESAGAHLALMTAFANEGSFLNPPYTLTPRYVVDVYGPTNLMSLYRESGIRKQLEARLENYPEPIKRGLDISQYLFGFDPKVDSARTKTFANAHSPLSYVSSDSPPLLMIHGDSDQVVPYHQSELLQKAYEDLRLPFQIHQLKNTDHAFRGATSAQKQQVQDWIIEFVEAHYQQ